MDRHTINEVEWLLNQDETAYQVFGLDQNAPLIEIKRKYRQLVLTSHPDKSNSDTSDLFKLINVCYNILSNDMSRAFYDKELQTKLTPPTVTSNSSSIHVKRKRQQDLDTKIEGLKAQFHLIKKNYIPTNDTQQSQQQNSLSSHLSREVLLKWKNKPNVNLDNQTVHSLMSVFGSIHLITLHENPSNDNYHFATIEFNSPISSALASTHDFTKTDDLWDHIGLRKVSSLLRSAQFKGEQQHLPNYNLLNSQDYIASSILSYT